MSLKIQKRGGVVHNGHRGNDGELISNCGSGERYAMGSTRQTSRWIELADDAETTCKKCKKQADEAERLGLHLTTTGEDEAAHIEDGLKADVEAGAYNFVNEVAIMRDAPGHAIVTAAFDGQSVGGSIVRKGKRLVLTAGQVTVSATTFEKVAKRLAQRLRFRAEIIDVVKAF